MVKKLDSEDRGILQFRPNIQFVEPEVEPQAPNPTQFPQERDQLEDALGELDRLRKLAQAVDTLAGAVQSRADARVIAGGGMTVSLDSSTDTDTVQAMIRAYPGEDPNRITYDQYRKCKDMLRQKGIDLAGQGIFSSEDDIRRARDEAQAAGTNAGTQLGGFNTDEAAQGLTRPELKNNFIIIPPLPIPEIQISLICILINFIWKEFVKPFIVSAAGFPVGTAFSALPNEICDPGFDLDLPGLIILGKEPNIPEPPPLPTDVSEVANL